MAKVSVGLRGWRFEEADIFTPEGRFKPVDEMPKESLQRLVRLTLLIERPCDACYLVHGEAEKKRCREAEIVYGEPLDEVVLCADHEADFLYWFRECGGREYAGDPAFRDEFHEWFASGERAPDGYGGLEHVDTDPDSLPEPPDPKELQAELERDAGFEGERIDLLDGTGMRESLARAAAADDGSDGEDEANDADEDDADEEAADVDVSDLDLDTEYPTG